MDRLDVSEAMKLVRNIYDINNPQASLDAIALRDKWLLENDLGLLEMTTDVRAKLIGTLTNSGENS